jgi:hypothetical protein
MLSDGRLLAKYTTIWAFTSLIPPIFLVGHKGRAHYLIETCKRTRAGVSASHQQNCTAGNRQTEKGKSGFGLPLFFLNSVWLSLGFMV